MGNIYKYNQIGGLSFDGEYVNGKKSRGKEYDYNGNLIFEGKYLNGKQWNRKLN